jgi:hypothetical protein
MAQRLLLVAIVVALAFTTFWLSRTQEPAPPVPVASGVAVHVTASRVQRVFVNVRQ